MKLIRLILFSWSFSFIQRNVTLYLCISLYLCIVFFANPLKFLEEKKVLQRCLSFFFFYKIDAILNLRKRLDFSVSCDLVIDNVIYASKRLIIYKKNLLFWY